MRYLNEQGNAVSVQEIRDVRPDMSIPEGADLTEIGYRLILPPENFPEPGPGQVLVLGEPAVIDGVLREVYHIVAAPPPIATACSPAQGLVALFALKGITESDIHEAIEAIPDPISRYTTKVAFARATEWRRGSPAMQAMAALLNLSEADLDALYVKAASVTL